MQINICTYQWHPPLSYRGKYSGDLTEYHVKNLSPGALPDVYTPIHDQEWIGIGDLIL